MVGLIAYHSWTASTKRPLYPAFTVIAPWQICASRRLQRRSLPEFQRSGPLRHRVCFELRAPPTTFLVGLGYWVTRSGSSTSSLFAVTCLCAGFVATGFCPAVWLLFPLLLGLIQVSAGSCGNACPCSSPHPPGRAQPSRSTRPSATEQPGRLSDQYPWCCDMIKMLPVCLPPAADLHGAALDWKASAPSFRHRALRPRH